MLRTLGALLLGLLITLGAALPAAAAVKVNVNDAAITDLQIAARTKLLALERRGAGAQAATKELIDEALMLQEAKRLGITISDAEVEGAVQDVARNLKLSRDKLVALLQANGVSLDTLKDRLRATLAWKGVVGAAVRPNLQMSDLQLEQQAESKVTATNSFDYVLKEILFVATSGNAGSRTGQANAYRSKFTGCDTAVQLSTQFTDAAVVDVGRRHATQLPDAIAAELANLNVGGITKPRVTANGVSMLAVCSKAVATDTTFIKQDIQAEAGQEQLASAAQKYLDDLRAKANIVYN